MSRIWETISAAPAEAWVGLIGVIFGALLASFTAWLTSRASRKQLKMQLKHEERMQRKRLTKERLEELYSLLSEWELQNNFSNIQLSLVISGNAPIQQFKDAMASIEEHADFNRIVMIAGVYGQSFKPAFEEFQEARNELIFAVRQGLESYLQATPNKAFPQQIALKQPRLAKAIEDLKNEIVKATKEV